VFSAVSAGAGVALTSDAFTYAFDDRIKVVHLTPEPKRATIGISPGKQNLVRRRRSSASARKKPSQSFVSPLPELLHLGVHRNQLVTAGLAE
jgi:hypothetical protein